MIFQICSFGMVASFVGFAIGGIFHQWQIVSFTAVSFAACISIGMFCAD
jgi:hypothetical protein